MTTPQDPEDEPSRDELPDDSPDDSTDGAPDEEAPEEEAPDGAHEGAPDKVSAEDELWRAIVENYGDRPQIAGPEDDVPPPTSQHVEGLPAEGDTIEPSVPAELEEHYVPPVPPPLPKPPPARLLAWTGLFGVPTFVLVALVARIELPSWLGLVLMVWFVGGFVFLVASMRPGPEDYDDGARL